MDGIAQIQRYRPDLVVLDIMLPDIDGFQVPKVRAAGCFMPRCSQREHKKVAWLAVEL